MKLFDRDLNNVIDFFEFKSLIKSLEPKIPDAKVLSLFKKMIRDSAEIKDSIEP